MPMRPRQTADNIKRIRERIVDIRRTINTIEYLCSGTLMKRMKLCGSPRCRCAIDPSARHGPYYEWGHMKGGRLVGRMVSPSQAAALRSAIAHYRKVRTLLRKWGVETERLIDLEHPRS